MLKVIMIISLIVMKMKTAPHIINLVISRTLKNDCHSSIIFNIPHFKIILSPHTPYQIFLRG